jgi:hypothetical protein
MSWTFTQVVKDAEDISEETVKAAVGTWLTEEESTLHIPAAVAAVKALVTAFKAKLPANVTLSGHSGVDPTADPSSVTVSVVVPPKAAVPVAVATPVAPVVTVAAEPVVEASVPDAPVAATVVAPVETPVAAAPAKEDAVNNDISEAKSFLEKAEADAEAALAKAKADLASLV